MGFLKRQWRDIAGNVKFWLLTIAVGGLMTLFTALTHGLTRWQQAGLVALFVLTIAWAVLSTVLAARQKGSQQTSLQPVIKAGGLEENVQSVEKFYKAYDGPLLQETTAHFNRLAAHYDNTAEREQFLIKALAAAAVSWMHDSTWSTIFRSQILALQDLNTVPAANVDQLKPYYDAAVAADPDIYKPYSFENWLGYMTGQNIIRQDANVVQITVRGVEFLKYMVIENKSPNRRKY